MLLHSFLLKKKAKEALKGDWLSALLVTFFSGILLTAGNVLSNLVQQKVTPALLTLQNGLETYSLQGTLTEDVQQKILALYQNVFDAVRSIPMSLFYGFYAVMFVALLVTPVMSLSSNHYFLRRLKGEQPTVIEGLFSRIRMFLKALGLYLLMGLRIFLWSLLLIVPGIVASIRYSQAPYLLAENPDMKITEAINKSKEIMAGNKMNYFTLELSFIGWYLVITVVQTLLANVNTIVQLVAAQFMSLWLSTYMNATLAAFHAFFTKYKTKDEVIGAFRTSLRDMGMPEETIHQTFDGADAPTEELTEDKPDSDDTNDNE